MMRKGDIALIGTGAIGDAILAGALVRDLNRKGYRVGLVSKGFTLGLWDGLGDVETYAFEQDGEIPLIPGDRRIVDLRSYLAAFPHTQKLPRMGDTEGRHYGHLSQWLGHLVSEELEIPVALHSRDVRIALTDDEVAFAREELGGIRSRYGGKPVVVLAPVSATKNRNLSRATLEHVVRGLQDEAVPCLLTPYPDSYSGIEGMYEIGDKDLRKASALLLAADAYVGVDSGPLHMVNGAINGVNGKQSKPAYEGMHVDPRKVIVVLGSSRAETVAYWRNTTLVAPDDVCPAMFCGSHGYHDVDAYSALFDQRFVGSGVDGDKSGCVDPSYATMETAPCMEAVAPERIIGAVREYLALRREEQS